MGDLAAFHHIALTVSDLDRSLAWYTEVLGLRELFREEGGTRRAAVMGFAGGGYSIGLVQHLHADNAVFDPLSTGLDHLAFSVASLDDLTGWAERLDHWGIEHSGVLTVPPGAILNFSDPDGIALALFWDDPVAAPQKT